MPLILTFLGKGGTGRTTVAIAAAQQLANQGLRVLLAGQDSDPSLNLFLDTALTADPQSLGNNWQAVQLQTAVLLERSWEELKKLEAQYLRSPLLNNVYGQELTVFPGLDSALALNALREYEASGNYDVIIYDGPGDQRTLRMLGLPEVLSWYVRRFRAVLEASDLWKSVSPFIQPIASTVLNVSWSGDLFSQPSAQEAAGFLEKGRAALADPNRVAAYLLTTDHPVSVATAKYLWGSAQQNNLTVGGVLLNQGTATESISSEFAPLQVASLPSISPGDWSTLSASLPDLRQAASAPRPLEVDVPNRQVRLFLPGFAKTQVKLSQSGPEVTIDAGDQRRNILLPPPLSGQPVKGAKFQNGYLIISF